MHFSQNEIYHIYNRGNDKQLIFFNDNNYIFFLNKIRKEWTKHCEILCYCLMPNHFHFMLVPNEEACRDITLGDKESHLQTLSKAIGKTLSSYTKAINNQNQTTGNLFQKKTQTKCLSDLKSPDNNFTVNDYLLTCFHYIHQNPKQAGMVKELSEWRYSSYPDYYGYRNGTLCNKKLAMDLLSLSEIDFKEDNFNLNEKIIGLIF
ncbi:MAG: transposase [Bacteroidota bacterium]|nr:transposase [Bacteroidota bacterium]